MEGEFYCVKPGGIKLDSSLIIMEGTKEKGPWYPAYQFSDTQIAKWADRGWIFFREAK
jgi:hypothetical protein